ncbi:extracellular solute-binding protein [Anaerocolumna sp. AGMB13025]|uniref:extracellular solute-binding protein n=1 Tax=Anaerocolumna sp. AGMB13025 TaxID=3039116 RepID=UPI00241D8338|nr:extracellular solute-binding protein [Anaerocolumna sp. AGMB13025]WFR56750.1 extracellular solute-binding protein [Anaerocolumna sp. AGMB13025]
MDKKNRRIFAVLLLVVLVMSGFSGCGKNPQSTGGNSAGTDTKADGSSDGKGTELTEPGTFPITNEKQSFSIMIPQMGTEDVTKSYANDAYEEKTNVSIDWIVVPADSWNEKVSIVMASGDLPDVICGMDTYNVTPTNELLYANQGLIVPLNEVIDKNSVNFKKLMADDPQVKKLISQNDGKIYSLPGIAVCYHCNYSQKMYINSTWLKNLGLKMPTTIDEYYNVLKAFKEKDANGNGDPNDEIPLIANSDGWHTQLDGFLMNAFTYCDADTHLAVEDGKLIYTATTDQYREGVKFLNKLYNEGLLSPEAFTNNQETNAKINVSGGDYAMFGSYPTAYQIYSGDTDIWKQYDILPPLKGADGTATTPNYELTRDVIRGNMVITSAAKNPDLIMRWIDYFYSDEGAMFRTGREGIEWRKAESGELGFDGEPADYALLKTPEDDPYYNNIDFTQSVPVMYSKKYREGAVAAEDFRDDSITNGTEIQLFRGTKAYEEVARSVDQSIPTLNVDAEAANDYSRLQIEIKDYQEEALVKFITGGFDINNDKDWNSYKTDLDNIGLSQYLDISNKAYQNYISR